METTPATDKSEHLAVCVFESREEALASTGDVRVHYKGGIYRALFTAIGMERFSAEQLMVVRPASSEVVEAAQILVGARPEQTLVRLAEPMSQGGAPADVILIAKATDATEPNTTLMIYEHLYPHPHAYYARPLDMFEGVLPGADGRPRFAHAHQ